MSLVTYPAYKDTEAIEVAIKTYGGMFEAGQIITTSRGGDLYFYHRMHGQQQAKGYMKPTQMEIVSFITYFNTELVGYTEIDY